VHRQEILIVNAADTGIPAAAAPDRTETADSLEIVLQHGGIVIEVITVPALAPARCGFFTAGYPPGQIHGKKGYETHGAPATSCCPTWSDDKEKIGDCQRKK